MFDIADVRAQPIESFARAVPTPRGDKNPYIIKGLTFSRFAGPHSAKPGFVNVSDTQIAAQAALQQ